MISLVEYSQYASIFAILFATSLMTFYILRIVNLDLLNAFPGGVVRVPQTCHRIKMETQSLEVGFEISETTDQKISLRLKASEERNIVTLRAYWGVEIERFYHVLRSPSWTWFKEAFLKGNLFGADACLILDPMKEIDVQKDPIFELDIHQSLELGQAPRTRYPLVLVVMNEQSFNINVIHVEDKSFMSFPSHILGQYVKLPDSSLTHLVPIYNAGESSECVVCISKPATRVTLPCRHASTCGKCFSKLPQNKCPMCRCQIQSFFLIRQEDNESSDEEELESEIQSDSQLLSWRQRLAHLEHRFAMAVGLQEPN